MVEHMKPKLRKNQKDMNKEKDGNDNDSADDDTDGVALERLRAQLDLFVKKMSKNTNRNDYKAGLVYQTRKDVITDFLAKIKLKKCQNPQCGA